MSSVQIQAWSVDRRIARSFGPFRSSHRLLGVVVAWRAWRMARQAPTTAGFPQTPPGPVSPGPPRRLPRHRLPVVTWQFQPRNHARLSPRIRSDRSGRGLPAGKTTGLYRLDYAAGVVPQRMRRRGQAECPPQPVAAPPMSARSRPRSAIQPGHGSRDRRRSGGGREGAGPLPFLADACSQR